MSRYNENLDEIKNLSNTDINNNNVEPEWNLGPDSLCPAESFFSNKLDTPIKLRSNQIDFNKFPPISIYTMFKQTVDKRPDHYALGFQDKDNNWVHFTYEEYWKICNKAAKSFMKLNLEPNSVVTIMGFNSPQFFISVLGSIFAAGVACGIYTTNSTEQCEHILNDSGSQIVVVENKQYVEKILKCKTKRKIKAIIQYSGVVEENYNGLVLNWSSFIEIGNSVSNEELQKRIKQIAPNKCASLIYTSGTTGSSKAAMISHDCLTYITRNVPLEICKLKLFEEKFVSYLPLSHIAAQTVDLFAAISLGATTYFAKPDALKGSLVETLQSVRPTFFWGVPRVWEKMQEKIDASLSKLPESKLKIFKWANQIASEYWLTTFEKNRCQFSFKYELAKLLVLNKIHKILGLDNCKNFFSGAAPITKETLDFFVSIGLPLLEVYGMSETCGAHSCGIKTYNRVTSVGQTDQYNRSKIINKDKNDDSGELCIYGRHVFMGYLNEEVKTKETFDKDGWLCTGDIAKIDSDGFIYITGRLKELIITAGGENIAPVPIEDKIKSYLPHLISNCMVVGDKKKYLVVLVTLKSKIDLETSSPLEDLTGDCVNFLKSIGSNSSKVLDIIDNKDPIVYRQIENGIKSANEFSLSRAAKVQKFAILPRDFSLANGELGPTLKLRRPIVAKMYSSVIDKLYQDVSGSNE